MIQQAKNLLLFFSFLSTIFFVTNIIQAGLYYDSTLHHDYDNEDFIINNILPRLSIQEFARQMRTNSASIEEHFSFTHTDKNIADIDKDPAMCTLEINLSRVDIASLEGLDSEEFEQVIISYYNHYWENLIQSNECNIELVKEICEINLDLSRNIIQEIPEGIFDHFNLVALDLSENNIERLPNKLFEDKQEILVYLDFSHNQIAFFPKDILEMCPKVTDLGLKHNKITTLRYNTFCKQIFYELYLSNNNLHFLSAKFADNFKADKIELYGNKFKIDHIKTALRFINALKEQLSVEKTCDKLWNQYKINPLHTHTALALIKLQKNNRGMKIMLEKEGEIFNPLNVH